MMTATLQRHPVPVMYSVPTGDKTAATFIADAAWGGILVTMSETDSGQKSWVLTKGARTVEVTSLQGLADAIAEMRGF